MGNDELDIYIIARTKLVYLCKMCRAPYSSRSISINADRGASADSYHIQTPAGASTICDHVRK